jgi:hypothetical protein
VKAQALAFAAALALWALVFVGLDYAVMKMMGLTLIYHP